VQVLVLESLRRLQQNYRSQQIDTAISKLNSKLMDVTTVCLFLFTFSNASLRIRVALCNIKTLGISVTHYGVIDAC